MDFDSSAQRAAAPGGDPDAESADQLRERAAACRRLAGNARTRAGTKALEGLGDHFDERARRLDPGSMRR
ncbi:MAG: hypothetical protein ACJ8FL_06060 [Sphingomicrobium sp.]